MQSAGPLPTLGSGLVSPIIDPPIDLVGASPATIGWMISAFTAGRASVTATRPVPRRMPRDSGSA
jgi:hypothetical protein